MVNIYNSLIKLIKSVFNENGEIVDRKKRVIKNVTEYDNDSINFNEWTNKKIKKSLGKDFEIKFQDNNYCVLAIKKDFIAISYGHTGLHIKPYKVYWRALRFPSIL